jgi:hypothetical protein
MAILRYWGRRLLLLLVVGATLVPVRLLAQDDPSDVPLGDVARNLRKKAPTKPVIDDDNLSQVMQEADSRKGFGSSLRFLMAGDLSGFRVSAPDVTCNLSFSSNVKSLLAGQYSEMDLPASDLARLEGHAAIQGDALNVSVHNGTDWHVSEIAVAVTIVKKIISNAANEASSNLEPAPAELAHPAELQTDKKPDTTVIYRMRAVGVPWSVTTFSSRLQTELGAGSEWHWAVVEARGYPPESYRRRSSPQADAENDAAAALENREGEDPAVQKVPAIAPVSNTGNPQLTPSNPQ